MARSKALITSPVKVVPISDKIKVLIGAISNYLLNPKIHHIKNKYAVSLFETQYKKIPL
ncbi:hypothetical protein DSM106972_022180 [Dulcicalothrix desertica PCC 7102]|uniref:Uncharacterized protein n=1 Tax=Dulcicalothrix desertica PCC 7102 TaxID=232991 RepID=A0A3S1APP5_9CYAN|nr:hypothetical protein DSM106972_022180 [Dulcicalothrix desertica PCC 7102]